MTLKEMTIIIVAWISRRQKIGSKKGEDRNFRELRAKMGFESQRLCGFQNCSVEMEESRLRELRTNMVFMPVGAFVFLRKEDRMRAIVKSHFI